MTLPAVQEWLVHAFASWTRVGALMHTTWGWPSSESAHFIGLSLLFGPIAMWDLRLLGMGRRIPIRAMHALVPWAIGGFVLTALSGVTFLMAEPTEYIYNPAFQFKMLFMTLAGVNALLFYPTVGRHAMAGVTGGDAPAGAKVMALASLSFWIAVIVCGRLLTFYRPAWCDAHPAGWLLVCVPLSMR